MRISRRYGFIYFSMPKTASESVRAMLDPHSDVQIVRYGERTEGFPFYSHMRPLEAAEALHRMGEDFSRFQTVMTVRNPWTRMASLYRMMKLRLKLEASFTEWLHSIDPNAPANPPTQNKAWDHGALSVKAFSQGMVQHQFRIEHDQDALLALLSELGLPNLTLPHVNASKKPYDHREMYSAEDIELVGKLYAEEIERFGYTAPNA